MFTPINGLSGLSLTQMVEELQLLSDDLVKRSLSQYVAYSLKEAEARAYLADPMADVSFLTEEAPLRGMTVESLAKLVVAKAGKMKAVVSGVELLKIELISRFKEAPNKLDLREDILNRAKALL